MTKYGYCRVSSQEQVDDGKSIEAQKQILLKAGVPIENIFCDEGISGGVKDDAIETKYKHRYFEIHIDLLSRKALMQLLEIIHPNDQIFITKFDRISRNVIFQDAVIIHCNQRNITIEPIEEPFAKHTITRRLMAVFSEGLLETTKNHNETSAKGRYLQGKWIYRPPIGYDMNEDGSLRTNEKIEMVKDIFQRMAKGEHYQTICNTYSINNKTLYNIIKNKCFLGMTHLTDNDWKKTELIPQVISEQTWKLANANIKTKSVN